MPPLPALERRHHVRLVRVVGAVPVEQDEDVVVDGGDGLLAQLGVARVGVEFGYSGVHSAERPSQFVAVRSATLQKALQKGYPTPCTIILHINHAISTHSIASVTYSSIIGELIGSFASAASAACRFAATLPAAAAGLDAAAGLAAAALTAGLATEAVVRLVVALVDDDEAAVDFGGGRGAAGGSASLAKPISTSADSTKGDSGDSPTSSRRAIYYRRAARARLVGPLRPHLLGRVLGDDDRHLLAGERRLVE